ncbi:MAG: DMT family transporter [Candidatus Bathyarchaeia archaeon]
MRARTKKLALTEGILAGLLFGTAAIFIRGLPKLDAFAIAFWRLIIACLALAVILLMFKKNFHLRLLQRNLKDLAVLSFFLGLHFIFFVSAIKDTTILNATVLVNTTPIFSAVVSNFFYKIKPSKLAILGLTLSFVGVCVISYAETVNANHDLNQTSYSPSLKGDLEAVLAALAETVYLNYGRKVRKEADLLSLMLPLYFFSAFVVGIISVPASRNIATLPDNTLSIASLIGLGVLPTATAHTLYFSSLSNLKSFETATMALLEPVGATLLGISLFQEIPAPLFAVGATLILVGVAFVITNRS